MKTGRSTLAGITSIVFASTACSQTLWWGVPTPEVVVDSQGNQVSGANYKFELGAFAEGFDPEEPNLANWLTNWRVFDVLPGTTNFLNTENSVSILPNVTSGGTHPSVDTAFIFAGLNAYIWVRKGDDPTPGNEWFLGRSAGWIFPSTAVSGNDIEWGLDDLGPGEVPEWGRQNDVLAGPGVSTYTGTISGIQTHTFVPEPSAVLLSFVFGAGLALRRRR